MFNLILVWCINLRQTRKTAAQKDAEVKALESDGVSLEPTGYVH
jgi:hypothetical protein